MFLDNVVSIGFNSMANIICQMKFIVKFVSLKVFYQERRQEIAINKNKLLNQKA